MVKTSNSHYNNTGTQNLSLEMDLWCAFGKKGGKAFTAIKKETKQFGTYIKGVFVPTKEKEVITEFSIYYMPDDRHEKIFHVIHEIANSDHACDNKFETIQQAKRWIVKCAGSGFKYLKHF